MRDYRRFRSVVVVSILVAVFTFAVALAVYAASVTVAMPTVNPTPVTFSGGQVTLSCTTAGAKIRYTTDGTAPTATHGTLYTGPITISTTTTTTLKTVAYVGTVTSPTTINTYTKLLPVQTPTFTPGSTTFTDSSLQVKIACATSGAIIRYTTNGTDPTSTSAIYSSPLPFTATTTLKAKAFKSGMTDSGVASATYTKQMLPIVLAVAPSKNTINVGDCLNFTGIVTQGGKPVNGLTIGVQDPMKQQSIGSAATTDSGGKFTYYAENMCPAKSNDMAGVFEFTFFAGSTAVKSKVTVNTKTPAGTNSVAVRNTSNKTYKVRLLVDNVDKGTTTVAPNGNLTIFNADQFKNSTISATIMDNSGKTLWKTNYANTTRYTPQTLAFVNPFYNNYWANSTVALNGTITNRTLNGVGKVYNDYVNKQWTVGGVGVSASNNVTHGVSTAADLGVTGPVAETFLGVRAGCSVSCGASVGLEIKFCLGACLPIEPFFDLGCGASCSAEVASASLNVFDAGFSASATYK